MGANLLPERPRACATRIGGRVLSTLSRIALALAIATLPGPRPTAFAETRTELPRVDCGQEPSLASQNSDVPTSIEFFNETSGSVDVVWLDFEGDRILYTTLAAGASVLQETFVTHPWIILDASGQCLGIYLPQSTHGQAHIRDATAEGDLSVMLAEDQDPVESGTQLSYTAVVTSAGPDAIDATLSATTPANTTLAHVDTNGQGVYSGPDPGGTGTLVVAFPPIQPNAAFEVTIVLNVGVPAGQAVSFRAEVSTPSTDPNPVNDAATVVTTVVEARVAELSWEPPDPNPLAPPKNLVVTILSQGALALETRATPAPPAVTGYKVYRSSQPNVQPSPSNIFGTFPPSQTSAQAPVGSGQTYFVVTACYAEGESAPSNEADVELRGPTVTSLALKKSKLTVLGSGFQNPVIVFVDGVPFVSPPKLRKNGTKLIAKGRLASGQLLQDAIVAGREARIAFRNSDGGITNVTVIP